MERLRRMTDYCKTSGCYRHFLLRYFGERGPERCGNCGNCTGERRQVDITLPAQKILSGVARVERRFPGSLGTTLIVRMLRGSREQRVRQLGLDGLSTYGIMADTDRAKIREYIDVLVEQGYLVQTTGSFPVLQTTERARAVLRGEAKVSYAARQEKKEPTSRRRVRDRQSAAPEDSLYEALRGLRAELARAEGVPAYVVFSNATLADMAVKRPESPDDFLDVSGVGEYKAARYGRAFLEAIRNWESKKYSVGDD
jgi:ATP-dependent DNA helicase RecQ